jgi:hypothetical protein
MPLVVPNNGEGDALKGYVGVALEPLVLKLFKNNYTPGETTVAADLTEATFAGYSAKSLVPATWVVTEGAPGEAAYPLQTFTSSAAQTAESIYGYYLVRATSGRIAHVQRFDDGPYTIANLNDDVKVTPKITFD